MSKERERDAFDRLVGAIDGLPGVHKSRASTVTNVTPMLGDTQTFVVQTYKTEDGNFILVQMVDAEGRARLVLPPKVAEAIYRQSEAVVRAGRKARGRARWDEMPDAERDRRIAALHGGRKAG